MSQTEAADVNNHGQPTGGLKIIKRSWLRTEEEIFADTPSRRDGISYAFEICKKQEACDFMHRAVKKLFDGEGNTYILCVATTFFHRFFIQHSMLKCDFRDIAAACVFLACKSESNRRHAIKIAGILWDQKHPYLGKREEKLKEMAEMIIFLEGFLLKTLGLDINVLLPHSFVLMMMRKIDRGTRRNEKIAKAAYFLATEVLLITDWSVRYTPQAIASACLEVAASFNKMKIDFLVPTELFNTWYKFYDESLEQVELWKMASEILQHDQINIENLMEFDHTTFIKKRVKMPAQLSVFETNKGPAEGNPPVFKRPMPVRSSMERNANRQREAENNNNHPRPPYIRIREHRRRLKELKEAEEAMNVQIIKTFKMGYDGNMVSTDDPFGGTDCPV